MSYDHQAIEAKWQAFWKANKTFRATDNDPRPKYYVLDMFPYPSGAGLHVGHPEGYTATDIVARYKRMRGFNVLHPMGWDAFGLPAEQHAIQTGEHPAIETRRNIVTFKRQIEALGFSYDWDREISTCDADYYRWTQWIFLKLFEMGLAYQAEVPVNWCPALGTVLANEEVIDGKSERGGYDVIRKPMRQWILKITAYAERLLADLDELDWPEPIKEMQRNWIGKSVGAVVTFPLLDRQETVEVFTTRPDTLFGATYLVLAPEHPLVQRVTVPAQAKLVTAYCEAASRKTDLLRTDLAKEKSGVFTGAFARNPVNQEPLPIWVADYVLISYGTGAIMAVPAHDQRDWEFATMYRLPIREVVSGGAITAAAYIGDGALVNSGLLDGLSVAAAKEKIIDWLEAQGSARRTIRYRLRDWLFSRQRYWGEPFPILHRVTDGHISTVSENDLPIELPELTDFKPTGTGDPPLARAGAWVGLTQNGITYRRETHTMPQWAGSCWYYLRFIDPKNLTAPWEKAKEAYWMPVDLYIGGAEHAVLHLLYARFWHKVLYDCGWVSTKEPFKKLVNQGMILGYSYLYLRDERGNAFALRDGRKTGDGWVHGTTRVSLTCVTAVPEEVDWRDGKPMHRKFQVVLEQQTDKMSKSRGNVVNPDDVLAAHGADAFRLYEMFMGPLEATKPWQTEGVAGVERFLLRVWRRLIDDDGQLQRSITPTGKAAEELLHAYHSTLKKVTEDLEALRFNTAISSLMSLMNLFIKLVEIPKEIVEGFVLMLAPLAPHIGEELWERLGHSESLAYTPWPVFDPVLAESQHLTIAVQINGKTRATVRVDATNHRDDQLAAARLDNTVQRYLEGKTVVKEIVVPGKIVNFVVR